MAFSLNDNVMVTAGRYNVFVHAVQQIPIVGFLPLNLKTALQGTELDSKETQIAIGQVDISHDSRFIAVADVNKHVLIFEFRKYTWEFRQFLVMDKRVTLMKFSNHGDYLVLTDKTGDVYVSMVGRTREFSTPKKILGHTSFILDSMLTSDDRAILTCDRDEKIRVSSFPMGHEIQSYALGHTVPVVNVVIGVKDNYMVSVGSDGSTILWHVREGRHTVMGNWNVFTVLQMPKGPKNVVTKMRGTGREGKMFIALLIFGYPYLVVFEISPLGRSMRLYGQTKVGSHLMEFRWVRESLYAFNPEMCQLNKYKLGPGSLMVDASFRPKVYDMTRTDWMAYAEYHRQPNPTRPLRQEEVDALINEELGLIVVDEDSRPSRTYKGPNRVVRAPNEEEEDAQLLADINEKLVPEELRKKKEEKQQIIQKPQRGLGLKKKDPAMAEGSSDQRDISNIRSGLNAPVSESAEPLARVQATIDNAIRTRLEFDEFHRERELRKKFELEEAEQKAREEEEERKVIEEQREIIRKEELERQKLEAEYERRRAETEEADRLRRKAEEDERRKRKLDELGKKRVEATKKKAVEVNPTTNNTNARRRSGSNSPGPSKKK